MNEICILDYGMGNIKSLNNAIHKIGHKTNFFSESSEICSTFLIIPGVGAFNSAIEIFRKKFIDIKIKKFLKKKGNFLLGICLGKQLLYSMSKENGLNNGLNLIKGEVELLSTNNDNKLPHVGWKNIKLKKTLNFKFLNTFENEKFYFTHSYVGIPASAKNILATTNYANKDFCSIVTNNKNLIGVQFHPEKSANVGLEFLNLIIKNFHNK
jgi:glutamine amidotransferase